MGGGASIMSIGLLHGHVTRQKIHSNTLPEIVTIAIARNRRKYIKTVTLLHFTNDEERVGSRDRLRK